MSGHECFIIFCVLRAHLDLIILRVVSCVLCALAAALCIACPEFDSKVGLTALMRATAEGHADCVRLLLDASADKEAKDNVRRRSLRCC
jgi:hypothetical protein